MSKKGVLLINLGTPDHCDPRSVRRYLKEFLHDERVIDLNPLARWALVNLLILPLRTKKSAAAYQKIWQPEGSPLLINSQQLTQALSLVLGEEYQVELGMRYGRPDIASALEKLQGVSSLTVIPLFPQYSSAATGSAIEKMLQTWSKQWNTPELRIKNHFYAHPGFIAAYADIINKQIQNASVDLLLFSYHGLPERHISKSDCRETHDRMQACPAINSNNLYCYRAQCYTTSDLIAKELGLSVSQYAVSFQSRLGRTPWIKPYTDLLLPDLIKQGVKKIAIVCPSFTADCLETLEEVNIRAREQWLALGGSEFTFIPCLNASPLWVQALADIARS